MYDIWKFIGVINYQVTFTLVIAYYINSNFASQYLLDIFYLFIAVRPALIIFFTVFLTMMEAHKTFVQRTKYFAQKKIDEQNFEYAKKFDKNLNGDMRGDSKAMKAKKQADTDQVHDAGEDLDGIVGVNGK